MSPQRRTALVSVGAACLLIAIKLVAGLASSSLGLLAEAAHSGTDLAAALVTLFAVSVAVRPADSGHPFGHGKAQNLAALAEAGFLIVVSLFIAGVAIARLAGVVEFEVDATWWTFAAIALVLAIDASRLRVSPPGGPTAPKRRAAGERAPLRERPGRNPCGARRPLRRRARLPRGDSIAALFVAALVIAAASRLLRRNVHVLMDRAPVDAEENARRAIAELDPPVELRRLRVREAGGAHFADVVIGVRARSGRRPGACRRGSRRGGAARAAPRSRRRRPRRASARRKARRANVCLRPRSASPRCARSTTSSVLEVDGRVEVSLHLKLPGDLPLEHAHEIAEEVEHAILAAVPEVESVRTHLEPIAEAAEAREVAIDTAAVERVVREETGAEPRELRFVRTDDGLVVFLTVGLEGGGSLASAHDRASAVEERIRTAVPGSLRRRGAHRAVRLCMFHPVDHPLERGWVGRVDGERVIQLAAQTLQAFFTGGGLAREHAVYPLDAVRFARAGPAPSVRPHFRGSVVVRVCQPGCHPRAERRCRRTARSTTGFPSSSGRALRRCSEPVAQSQASRLLAEWRAPDLTPPEGSRLRLRARAGGRDTRRSAACARGECAERRRRGAPRRFDGFDWAAAHDLAGDGTTLVPGDVIAGPALGVVERIEPGDGDRDRRRRHRRRCGRPCAPRRSSDGGRSGLGRDGHRGGRLSTSFCSSSATNGIYDEHRGAARPGAHAQRGHRGRVRDGPSAAREVVDWMRENVRLRAASATSRALAGR